MTPEEKIKAALDLIVQYGGSDEAHHLKWVVDQVARILAADAYEQLVRDAKAGVVGPDTYAWDEGIPP